MILLTEENATEGKFQARGGYKTMRCTNCPLYRYYSNEDGSFSECELFGDDWEQPFHYEDKHGDVIGCYIEKAYIDKVEKRLIGTN